MKEAPHLSRVFSAMFLVAGTCIGGGMLALPSSTGVGGFLPAAVSMCACWFAMTLSALLLVEVNLWLEEGAHIITMSSKMLGPAGKFASWLLYLFVCYASIIAYTAAGGEQMGEMAQAAFGWALSKPVSCLLFMLLFGLIIDCGAKVVGRVNAVVFIGMVGAFACLIFTGANEVDFSLLTHRNWSVSYLAVPLLLTSFSFQTMVPSLTPYLKRDPRALRWAVIGGTTLTLVLYLIWEAFVLGIVPLSGEASLTAALIEGKPATNYLRVSLQNPFVALLAQFFAFFALVTSFLGIALGLFDFLSDGLKIQKKGWGKIALGLLISLPTLYFAIYHERIFLEALDLSGGFGDTLLNGIIPVLMVWMGRYYLRYPKEFRVPGGKLLLVAIALFYLFSLGVEIAIHAGWAPSAYDVGEENLL